MVVSTTRMSTVYGLIKFPSNALSPMASKNVISATNNAHACTLLRYTLEKLQMNNVSNKITYPPRKARSTKSVVCQLKI